MTKQQLDAASKIAQSEVPLLNEDLTCFDGFALADFKPVTCTVPQLAALIRWQCQNLNGSYDGEALQEIANAGRYKFTVIGTGA